MEKSIVLCSGGFDSVALLYWVAERNVGSKDMSNITVLFFDYEQKSQELERKWAKEHAERIGCNLQIIEIPKFTWSNTNFYGSRFSSLKDQELEARNLIFVSYAISYAKAKGIDNIYIGLIKSGIEYWDSNKCLYDELSRSSGVQIKTPFRDREKGDLLWTMFKNKVQSNEFWSCDYPDSAGNPCGECDDCKIVQGLRFCLDINTLHKSFVHHNMSLTEEVKKAYMKQPLDELRILWNNDCQLKCKHCFYGFNEMKGWHSDKQTTTSLINNDHSTDWWLGVIDEAIDLGITSIHFGGKEPLYDDSIFKFMEEFEKNFYGFERSLVTNGINVPKYGDQIKKYFSKIMISCDTWADNKIRNHDTYDAIQYCVDNDIPVEVFIDLHKGNYMYAGYMYNALRHMGVRSIYFRVLHTLGNAKDNHLERLSIRDIKWVIKGVEDEANKMPNFIPFMDCVLRLDLQTTQELTSECSHEEYLNLIKNYLGFGESMDAIRIIPEYICEAFTNQVTITPDGYVLGCGTDVCHKNYDKCYGENMNFIARPLKESLMQGREEIWKYNVSHLPMKKCRNEEELL